MEKLKQIILEKGSKKFITYLLLINKYKRGSKSIIKTFIFAIKALFRFYVPNPKLPIEIQIKKLFDKIKIEINENDEFLYSLDEYKTLITDGRRIDNTTIDYEKVLKTSIKQLREENNELADSTYKKMQTVTIDTIDKLIDKEIKAINKSKIKNKEQIANYFYRMKDEKAENFSEALQRILFYNQILWQANHVLSGLGRLDKILNEIYVKEKDKIGREEIKKQIKSFIKILHSKYWLKSNVLLGDTGQIIILGGKEENGEYFCNELTYIFIEAIKELQIPDPKVLLRVSEKTPRSLMELSLECIKTGVGCPLLSNDEVIISNLIKAGYGNDSYNYVTSACWEPLIVGKSVAQNNIDSLVWIEPLNIMLEQENLEEIKKYDDLLKIYKEYLQKYIKDFIEQINKIKWEKAPLLSLFVDGTKESLKDVSEGGAVYSDCGLTTVSLSNTVNAIYNIKKLVFEDKEYTLTELNQIRMKNYEAYSDVLEKLKKQQIRFGTDNDEIIGLTNTITGYANEILGESKNIWGGKIKIGYSAPTYIIKSENCKASLDGRKNGEPFGVHISSDKPSTAYTELIQFGAKLEYDGYRFNGNVIDFMITPSFIGNHFDKIVDFLILSIHLGFFQMQMNVTSSEILIKAKENPKEYENLIVRVWGFSAYFNDLPENYKDLLIERALKNEGKVY